jgi:hypothetical protein
MWSTGVNRKRVICFFLEALMVGFVFTYSWSLDAPNRESRASIQAAPTQQLVLRNTSGASELPYQLASKVYSVLNHHNDFSIDLPALEIATSDGLKVNPSLHNPFYAHTTINAP